MLSHVVVHVYILLRRNIERLLHMTPVVGSPNGMRT